MKRHGYDTGAISTLISVRKEAEKVTRSLPQPLHKLQLGFGGTTTTLSKKRDVLTWEALKEQTDKIFNDHIDSYRYLWNRPLILKPRMYGGSMAKWEYFDSFYRERKEMFDIGDTVRVVNAGQTYGSYDVWAKAHGPKGFAWLPQNIRYSGEYKVVAKHKHEDGGTMLYAIAQGKTFQIISGGGIQLVKKGTDKVETIGQRTFKLIRDQADYKKGLLVQGDGEDSYMSINHNEFIKFDDHEDYFDDNATSFSRKAVEENPTCFVEVFLVQPQYMTQPELDEFNTFKKKLAIGKKRVASAKKDLDKAIVAHKRKATRKVK